MRPDRPFLSSAWRLLPLLGFGALLWAIVALGRTSSAVSPAPGTAPGSASATAPAVVPQSVDAGVADAGAATAAPDAAARAAPEVLGMDPLGPSNPIVDDEFVYWISRNENELGKKVSRVLRVPKGGGAVTTLAEGSWIESIGADDVSVYWTESARWAEGRVPSGGAVRRVSKRGGKPATVVARRSRPRALALGGGQIYWLEDRAGQYGHSAQAIMTVQTAGPLRLRQLEAGNLQDSRRLWLDDARVFVSIHHQMTSEEAEHLIHPPAWPPRVSGTIVSYDRRDDRGRDRYVPDLCERETSCDAIAAGAASGGRVVWVTYDGTVLTSTSGSPDGKPVLLARGPELPTGIAIDGGHVYWVAVGEKHNSRHGKLLRVALDGGGFEVVAGELYWPWGLALDAHHIYWAEWGSGKIARIAKP